MPEAEIIRPGQGLVTAGQHTIDTQFSEHNNLKYALVVEWPDLCLMRPNIRSPMVHKLPTSGILSVLPTARSLAPKIKPGT